MYRPARRFLSTVLILPLLVVSITACMTTRQAPFVNDTVGLDRITGVSMRSGQQIPFRERGASITNDSLYAVGAQGQMVLPTNDISRVWTRKVSPVRTAGLVTGVVVSLLGIVAAIALQGNIFTGNH
jgi:hypothetical protein